MTEYVLHFTGENKGHGFIQTLHNLRQMESSSNEVPGDLQQVIPMPDSGAIKVISNIGPTNQERTSMNFLDLKPFFARGPAAKRNKTNAGWHTIVPIKLKQSTINNLDPGDKSLLSSLQPGDTITLSNLNQITNNHSIKNGELQNPFNHSGNVTGMGVDQSPIAFRTVSSNSLPSSWQIPEKRDSGQTIDVNVNTDDLQPSTIFINPVENINTQEVSSQDVNNLFENDWLYRDSLNKTRNNLSFNNNIPNEDDFNDTFSKHLS